MKITGYIPGGIVQPIIDATTASTSALGGDVIGSGGSGGGGTTVVGIGDVPVDAPDGVATDYLDGEGHWTVPAGSGGGLSTVTDGVTTVSTVTEETVPLGGVTDLTGGNAGLNFVTPTYGGQEKIWPVSASGASQTLDLADGNVMDVTLTAACTITLTAPPSGKACGMTLLLRQGGSGSYTVTWPGSVVWAGGSPPTLSTTVGDVDTIALFTVDGGSTWLGFGPRAGGSGGGGGVWRPTMVYNGSSWQVLTDSAGNAVMVWGSS